MKQEQRIEITCSAPALETIHKIGRVLMQVNNPTVKTISQFPNIYNDYAGLLLKFERFGEE